MTSMTGAQALVAALATEGVDTVFTLPGAQIMAAFDAFYDARDRVRLVHTRHEQATTYMADGYAKVTGRVGVAMVVPGPGALNAAAGLGTAYASSSPVLLISGQISNASLGRHEGQLHEVDDQLDVFRPITKWAHRVTSAAEVPHAIHEAMRQLRTGRPRPVELEITPDALTDVADIDIIEPEEYPPQAPVSASIDAAADLLRRSRSPALIAGGGVVTAGASGELTELAELLQAPVMTTPEGKGVVREDHPLTIGVNYSGLGPANRVVPESDLLLAVGTRFLLRGLEIGAATKVIQIDIDTDEIGRNHATDVAIVADARQALSALLDRLRPAAGERPTRAGDIRSYKDGYAAEVREMAGPQTDLVAAVRAELDEEDILVSGMTTVGYWSHVAYPVYAPRTYVTSSYFGTLGYAFPTALGAKMARPDRRVVALSGDGGFMYSPQELATAVRYGINVVSVVFNNSAFGASKWDQSQRYGERYIGTELNNPDFVRFAESFGAVGMRAEPDDLGPALRKALDADAPVVIEVPVPNMMPPFQIVR